MYTLTGSGTQALAYPASLAIVITAHPTVVSSGNANPTNYFHLGLIRLGTSKGHLPAIPIDAANQLVPCPNGANILGYNLVSGVTITVEERYESLSGDVIPDIISSFSPQAYGGQALLYTPGRAIGTPSPSANNAVLVPFTLNSPYPITNGFFFVSAGSGTFHYDIGVYDDAFNRLFSSGSISSAALSFHKQAMTASGVLPPGNFYLAFTCDSVTPTFVGMSLSIAAFEMMGVLEMAAALPLPATFTPAANSHWGTIPFFGFTNRSVP
jgi:hypothetical protein